MACTIKLLGLFVIVCVLMYKNVIAQEFNMTTTEQPIEVSTKGIACGTAEEKSCWLYIPLLKWTYNSVSNKCTRFLYNSCGLKSGTLFDTLEECIKACENV